MNGRDRARELLGVPGPPRGQVDSPWTPEEVSELTGQTWRWLNVGPGRWVQRYGAGVQAPPDIQPRWWPHEPDPARDYPAWVEMMGSRHGRWLIVWSVRPPQLSRNMRSIPFVGFTQPEFSREGAEAVWRQLHLLGLGSSALQSDNPSLEFVINANSSNETDYALERLGFEPPYHLLREGIQVPEYPEKGKYWGAYHVLTTKMMLDALDAAERRQA